MMGKIKAWLEDMSEAVYEASYLGLEGEGINQWVEAHVEYYDKAYVDELIKRLEHDYE